MPRKKPDPPPPPVETAAEVKDRLAADTPRVPPVKSEDLLSTGCTLMNMAFSGRPGGGVPKGNYLYFVGDSSSGKTWFSFNLFAEAARNPHFADHRFVFDNAENGALMDVEQYFGREVRERLLPPKTGKEGRPVYSETVQQLYFHLERNCEAGPCIYVLDSMDALQDDTDEEKFAAEFRYYETGKGKDDIPGSMGMAKAKTNSRNINRVVQGLRESGSILVVISQTRRMVGARFPTKTRAGGDALWFYAHLGVWTTILEPIKKTYLRKERNVGDLLGVEVRKNRVCGWEGKVQVPFLKGYGVDDLGASVDYLLDERHWTKAKKKGDADSGEEESGSKFAAPEFEFEGTKEQLIQKLQEAGDEWELSRLVARVWREIQAGAAPKRRPRYV